MKHNKLFVLLGAVSALAITGCNFNINIDTNNYVTAPAEAFVLEQNSVSLLVGESKQLEIRMRPSAAFATELVYEAMTPNGGASVCSVSKTGLVKALRSGVAAIKVYDKSNEDLVAYIPVYVADKASMKDLVAPATQMQKKNKATPVKKVQCLENRKQIDYRDGVAYKGEKDYQNFIVSTDDAYAYIDEYDEELRTAEGNYIPMSGMWAFYTDEDYATHLYHRNDSTKTRLDLNTQSYIGQKRVNAIYDVIDSIFTSGSKIFTQYLEGAYEDDFLGYIVNGELNKSTRSGVGCDGDLIRLNYAGKTITPQKVSADDESDYKIPAGTSYTYTYTYDMTWYKGVLVNFTIDQVMKYQIDGIDYNRVIFIEYVYSVNDEVEFELPNPKEYREVDDIFDL